MRRITGSLVCTLFVALPLWAQQPATGAIKGTVYDSIAAAPLAGALMQMISKSDKFVSYSATADSAGGFRAMDVRAGEYLIGFQADVLDRYGVVSMPLGTIRVQPGETAVAPLAVPSGVTLMRALCGVPLHADSSGAMSGLVLNAESGMPVAGAKLVVTWTDLMLSRSGLTRVAQRTAATTNAGGFFVACNLPTDIMVTFNAEQGSLRSGDISLTVPPMGLLHRDLAVADTTGTAPQAGRAAPGRASLSGIVRDIRGRPLANARVIVADAKREVRTNLSGEFHLDSLPSGTREVNVAMLGFAPAMRAVDLAESHPARTSITLNERMTTLSEVNVSGQVNRSVHNQDVQGFLYRMRTSAFGTFLGVDKIEAMQPSQTTDLFRAIAGVTVSESNNMSVGNTIMMRGSGQNAGCPPQVFIDKMPLTAGTTLDNAVDPKFIQGIEVYKDWESVPPEFAVGPAGSNCGAVVIWTKH